MLDGNIGRENTLPAFQRAAELGFRYLETDVHVTADGRLVAFHDPDLQRVGGRAGRIEDMTWDELRDIDIAGARIPLMDELLDALPDARFNVDLKTPRATEPLARCISAHGAEERVNVASFGLPQLHAFRRLVRGRVSTSVSAAAIAYDRFIPALPRLVNSAGVAVQIPVAQRVAGHDVRICTPALISRAHARGQQVHVWTVDDAAAMNELIDLGVDGIISDRPDVLRDVLEQRGMWA